MEDYAGLYGELHIQKKWFSGCEICDYAEDVKALIEATGSERLLDYGCGRGLQYSRRRIHKAWGVKRPHCFDVGVSEFSRRPRGKFDGVICCDVMEHIAVPDVGKVLSDVMGFANKFAFFVIGCSLSRAGKRLPDGRNVHLTVKPQEWWRGKINKFRPKSLIVQIKFDERVRNRERR